jgi:lysyl-tRNA synthetase class 2
MYYMAGTSPGEGRELIRSKAIAFGEVAARALRTAFPVIAVVAIYYALLLGVLNIMQAMGNRFSTVTGGVERLTHVAMWDGPAVVPLLLGAFMLVLAYELWLRKRAALTVLCGFIVAQALVDSVRGMSRGALVGAVLVAMLLAISVKQFPGKPDPSSLRKLRVAAPLLAGVFFTYGILGLFLMRGRLGIHSVNAYRLAYRSIAVAVGDSGLHFTGSAIAFKGSMTAIAIGGIAFLLFLLLRPYREKGAQAPELRQRARRVVEDYGSDSLAYFNMRHDKSVFFHGDECFLAYKVVGDVAVISGDPVGPSEQIPDTIRAFNDYCLARGWRLTILGASGTMMPYYEEVELRGFSLGEEAIVKVENFTLDGRQARKLRQSVNKIARDGYTMEFMYTASIPGHMKHELARISVDWRGGKQETGFSMGLGRLMSSEDPDCLLAVAYDADARPAGFLHFVPMYPHVGYSLDVHRSKIDSPGALSEFMIARTAEFLRSEGYRQMSLHFLAFCEHYREDRETPGSPLWRTLAKFLDRFLPIMSVYRFDRKFSPTWKKRYLLHVGITDLLLVGIAAIVAESAFAVTRPSDRKGKSEGVH